MTADVVCTICTADIPLEGSEKKGEEVFCTFCGAPHRLTANAASSEVEAEEDDSY